MTDTAITDDLASALVSACRTAVGDELRSVTCFTEDEAEQVYLREDLERAADLVGFVENERLGFRSQTAYGGTELGDYQFTVRAFDRGYLTRVVVGEFGAFVTTDEMDIDRFEEVAEAMRGVLREAG